MGREKIYRQAQAGPEKRQERRRRRQAGARASSVNNSRARCGSPGSGGPGLSSAGARRRRLARAALPPRIRDAAVRGSSHARRLECERPGPRVPSPRPGLGRRTNGRDGASDVVGLISDDGGVASRLTASSDSGIAAPRPHAVLAGRKGDSPTTSRSTTRRTSVGRPNRRIPQAAHLCCYCPRRDDGPRTAGCGQEAMMRRLPVGAIHHSLRQPLQFVEAPFLADLPVSQPHLRGWVGQDGAGQLESGGGRVASCLRLAKQRMPARSVGGERRRGGVGTKARRRKHQTPVKPAAFQPVLGLCLAPATAGCAGLRT